MLAERRGVAVLQVLLPAEAALELVARARRWSASIGGSDGLVGVLQLVADRGELLLLLHKMGYYLRDVEGYIPSVPSRGRTGPLRPARGLSRLYPG